MIPGHLFKLWASSNVGLLDQVGVGLRSICTSSLKYSTQCDTPSNNCHKKGIDMPKKGKKNYKSPYALDNKKEENCPTGKCCSKSCQVKSDPCCPDPCENVTCPPDDGYCKNIRKCCPWDVWGRGGCCEPDIKKREKRCEKSGSCEDECCPNDPKCPDTCAKKYDCFISNTIVLFEPKKRDCPPDEKKVSGVSTRFDKECEGAGEGNRYKKREKDGCCQQPKSCCERRDKDPCKENADLPICPDESCLDLDKEWPPKRPHCAEPKRDPCRPCQRPCGKKSIFDDGLC